MSAPQARPRFKVWDLPVRLFHWSLVATVAGAFLTGEEDAPLSSWHHVLGWVAAVLIAFRLVWGLVGGEHARFANFLRPAALSRHVTDLLAGRRPKTVGHNPLGGLAILALIALTLGAVLSGVGANEDLHEGVVWTLLALIGLHVAAVVAMSLASRENLVRAMVTGTKSAGAHPEAAYARRAAPWALPMAMALAACAAWGAQQIDPGAFTPGPVGGTERSGDQDRRSAERGEVEDD